MDELVYDTDSSIELSEKASDLGAAALVLRSCSAFTLTEELNVEVLNPADIVAFMNEMIREVSCIIGEDQTVTRLLLSHFKWDRHELLERFYGGDKRRLYAEAKITNFTMRSSSHGNVSNDNVFSDAVQVLPALEAPGEPAGATTSLSSITSASSKGRLSTTPVECSVCLTSSDMLESPDECLVELSCNHKFCKECLTQYITHSITGAGLAQNITCGAYGCNVLISDHLVMELISDDRIRAKYHHLISNSFVSCNRNLRWCPAVDCGKVIKAEAISRQVTCHCGERFCFQCGDCWHEPVHCDWMRYWKNKVSKDSSTVSWIASNTKECPKCGATIEKDGGCNHMICRKDNCLYEFCWVCMGPWQDHGQNAWYHCNRYNEKTSKAARSAMESSRSSILRFLHYYNRYSNHSQSMRFEADIHQKVNRRIEEIRKDQGRAWNEVNFMRQAVDMLIRARRTLMNTYIFAYFVKQNNQTLIFEDNQRDLEIATEQLSEYLERDIHKSAPEGLKLKVNDKSSYCGRRCAVLISHIQEGYENDWWEIEESRRRSTAV